MPSGFDATTSQLPECMGNGTCLPPQRAPGRAPSGPQAVFCAIIRLVNVPAALTMSTPSGFADKLNWPCMQDFVSFPLSRLQQRGVARWILQLLSMMDGQAFCPTQHLSFVTTTYPGYSLW